MPSAETLPMVDAVKEIPASVALSRFPGVKLLRRRGKSRWRCEAAGSGFQKADGRNLLDLRICGPGRVAQFGQVLVGIRVTDERGRLWRIDRAWCYHVDARQTVLSPVFEKVPGGMKPDAIREGA